MKTDRKEIFKSRFNEHYPRLCSIAYEYVSEGPGTGIGTPAQKPFELYTTDRRITICNLEVPATISVYALNGMCLHDQQAYAASCTVSVFEPGCYLLVVRMGERTYCEKVLL